MTAEAVVTSLGMKFFEEQNQQQELQEFPDIIERMGFASLKAEVFSEDRGSAPEYTPSKTDRQTAVMVARINALLH